MFPTKSFNATNTPIPKYPSLSQIPKRDFWLQRPISSKNNDYISPTYRYGSTQGGLLRVHHGVDFVNTLDTSVYSTTNGKVVFAGTDTYTKLGPTSDFYGKVIVIQSSSHYLNQPIYVLYGHLNSIIVSKGQIVSTGSIIGTVGGTGVAKGGTHLHMEVRIGYNDYSSTRNPELWLAPYQDWGTLAGRITDKMENLVPLSNITILSKDLLNKELNPVRRYLTSYEKDTVNSDEQLGENFVIADLPPGTYTISINTTHTTKRKDINILPNQINWIEFTNVVPPPTWTPTPTSTPNN
tara:strand:+ start:270 stop:1154 length:885 start_codon:yes stop_codon:yes gene_type:complete